MSSKIDYTASNKRLMANPQEAMNRQLSDTGSYLEAKIPQLEKWITGGVDPRALVRFALLDMSAPGPAGDKLRACSRESIYTALLACAVTGLEPGALKGEAYLVPYGSKATFIPGWKGLIKQARRSREVVGVHSNVVHEQDVFELDLGAGAAPVHRPFLRGDRGQIIGAYAVATMVGGHREVEWMDVGDLDRVRKVANGGPAWKDWADQMQRKAPIRRLAKRLPLGHDYFVALAAEHAVADGKSYNGVLDIVTDGEASRTEAQAGVASSIRSQVDGTPAISDEEAAEIARAERGEP
jgi:recombination protein RecT